MRILLVEDEEKLAEVLALNLRAEGFAVDICGDGAAGVDAAATVEYDLIILDILMPVLDGSQALQRIRGRDRDVPIIMLTARDSVQDKVRHFEAGADDYLTKPFSFAELLVRVRALLRRSPVPQAGTIRIANFELDRSTHKVRRGGQGIDLGAKEFALLEYLAVNAGRVLSRAMIIEHVWDRSFEGMTNIVDVYIHQLRDKVDGGFDQKLIRTVRGAGYVFGEEGAP